MKNIIEKDICAIIENLSDVLDKFQNKNILLAGGGGFFRLLFQQFFPSVAKKNKFNVILL